MELYRKHIERVERSLRREVERNALRSLLQARFDSSIRLSHLEDGRPVLPDYPDIHISVSHTEGLVMLSVSSQPIGLDVELRQERIRGVVQRLVRPELFRLMRSCEPDLQHLIYTIAFTAMEALYKLVPESRVLSDFDYVPKTFLFDKELQTFILQARYKESPNSLLSVSGAVEGSYVYSVAEYP